ncbi:MAG: hypothetical protein KC416_16900, partial [Myxococcales bacterium]|nr:hypothetical protein [Myxococcales bacterium]
MSVIAVHHARERSTRKCIQECGDLSKAEGMCDRVVSKQIPFELEPSPFEVERDHGLDEFPPLPLSMVDLAGQGNFFTSERETTQGERG